MPFNAQPFNAQPGLSASLRGYGQPQPSPSPTQDESAQYTHRGPTEYKYRATSPVPFDDTDPASPEGRLMAAYRALNTGRLNLSNRPDYNLISALSGLFGGGVSAGIGAEATLGLPGAQATAQNQFADAELERRASRMGQDLDQQRLLDEYSDEYLQRRQQAGGDRIGQLLEGLRQQQGGGVRLQERIQGVPNRGPASLLEALGVQ